MSTHAQLLHLNERIAASIVGQEGVLESLLIALLTNGNVLMEGLPGLAKTRAIKTLSGEVESTFRRIQFTPDLLPSDVTGTEVYYSEGGKGEFRFQPGPIFGNLILADEINRAPAKVQAALLEAMEERQVTVAGATHKLPDLFMVLATQNPIEQEGTYPLPEAQMDRFLLHVFVEPPTDENELKILRLVRGEESVGVQGRGGEAPLAQEVIFEARKEVLSVAVADAIDRYMVALVGATRRPERYGEELRRWIHVGASPRGTLALDRASRARAWLQGRDHVLPDDVQAVAPTCLRHRLVLSYEANAEGVTADRTIEELLKVVAVA
jgi:MoxR-like ATPase